MLPLNKKLREYKQSKYIVNAVQKIINLVGEKKLLICTENTDSQKRKNNLSLVKIWRMVFV